MNKVIEQIDALPLVEEIKNNESEVLPSEIQNINVPLVPEIISGQNETSEPVIHQYWPWAIIALGFVFTAARICLLGYALVKLVVLLIRAAS